MRKLLLVVDGIVRCITQKFVSYLYFISLSRICCVSRFYFRHMSDEVVGKYVDGTKHFIIVMHGFYYMDIHIYIQYFIPKFSISDKN